MINIDNLTIKYPNGKGIKDVSFSVKKGQVVGYLGPNGAGKTTTIRAIMGFVKPGSGAVTIDGRDGFLYASQNMNKIGYIPGEISFPAGLNARQLLDFTIKMRGLNNYEKRLSYLTDFLELDMSGEVNRFSKGMKQKLAIIIALLSDSEILILDEPSSGLDPLMQNKFIQLIEQEKAKNKAILLSSHIFEEIERTCDDVVIIKDGVIKSNVSVEKLASEQNSSFIITSSDTNAMMQSRFKSESIGENKVKFCVNITEIDAFIKFISGFKVDNFSQEKQSLEQVFIGYYKSEGKKDV